MAELFQKLLLFKSGQKWHENNQLDLSTFTKVQPESLIQGVLEI